MALPSDVQQQVYDLLSKASNLSFVSADTAGTGETSALSLAPGQRVTAEVLSTAQGNKVPVRIGNQQVNLEIPITVRPGQNLELTFVSDDPRPTFAMSRPGITAPPVTLSDASRLLSLLVSNEQVLDPRLRSTLQNIGDLLRRSSGDVSVLANFLDDVLTYKADGRQAVVATGGLLDQPEQQVGYGTGEQPGNTGAYLGKGTAGFEDAASKLLLNLARQSKFTLVEVTNQTMQSLPLKPGDEANALVQGTLPGGRVFVQLAGETLELQLSRPVQQGEILRLALVSQQPKTVFALLGMPSLADQGTAVSDTAKWLSSLAKTESGQGDVQRAVISRLQQVINSLPPGSPALAAIMDEAMIYGALPSLTSKALQGESGQAKAGKADIDDDVLSLLKGLMSGNRLALLESQGGAEKALQLRSGEQLKGEVLQNMGNGRFTVQVAGQNLEFILPKGMKAGDTLNLFSVGNDPPSFLLVRQGKGGDAIVSQTGRWVSTLLSMQNQSAPLTEGLGILKTILQGAPSDPRILEERLAKGLKESGLFYESHLARWFSGEYPLESILKEPQGKLSSPPNQLQQQPQSQNSPSVTESAIKNMPAKAELQADSRALPIIKEQLATLQTGQLLFQGELLPGQPMEWRIAEREGRRRKEEEASDAPQPWETSLSISLPGLGAVDASLKISGTVVEARVRTGSSQTADLLAEGRSELAEQFTAAGLEPGIIEVHYGGEPTQK